MSEWLEFLQDEKVRNRWNSLSPKEKARFMLVAPAIVGTCLCYAFWEWWDERVAKERDGHE